MAENKMKQVVELLGVEIGVPFKIKGFAPNYTIKKYDGLCDEDSYRCNEMFRKLLTGEYEIEQPILDDVEKRYLEGVLRPFKDKVEFIKKDQNDYGQWISIELKEDWFCLPYYEIDKMYKGMELNKEYTLQELGLFEDD